jgi:hypothetical protein
MVACDNAGLAVSSVSHIIDTNNVAAKLLLGQEAAAVSRSESKYTY